MTPKLIAAAAAAILASGCATAVAQTPASVTAELKNSSGQTVGGVTLTEAPRGVLIRIEAKGLAPGWHGLHIHEKGDCSSSDFTSAGGHTHGGGDRVHGLLNPKANETGDLPNLHAGQDGAAAAELFTQFTSLTALRDADGSALVVHAGPDDHLSQPIGGSGARVACAVVR